MALGLNSSSVEQEVWMRCFPRSLPDVPPCNCQPVTKVSETKHPCAIIAHSPFALYHAFTNAEHATPAPLTELIPALGGDKRDGSIVMNGWFSCPGVRRGGTERAVWFIF